MRPLFRRCGRFADSRPVLLILRPFELVLFVVVSMTDSVISGLFGVFGGFILFSSGG